MRSQLVEEAIKYLRELNPVKYWEMPERFGQDKIVMKKDEKLQDVITIVLNYIKELENGEVEKTNLKIAELEYKVFALQKNIKELKSKKELKKRCAIKKQVVEQDLEKLITFLKYCNNNNIYLTVGEANAIDTLECYIMDSTPNEVIRDKIEEYQNLLNPCNKKEDIERIKGLNERILILKEILGE